MDKIKLNDKISLEESLDLLYQISNDRSQEFIDLQEYMITMEKYRMKLENVLHLISNGYEYEIFEDNDNLYYKIENPNFKPDNGSEPFIIIKKLKE